MPDARMKDQWQLSQAKDGRQSCQVAQAPRFFLVSRQCSSSILCVVVDFCSPIERIKISRGEEHEGCHSSHISVVHFFVFLGFFIFVYIFD
ncbi:hypothetical protein BS78_09G188400 [Paspalum vaginatum]|nr:hypothetical protein BS78_09G188400 [Paspalum vaginatum]